MEILSLSGLHLFLSVTTAIGNPASNLERVFQIFKRLHTQDQYGGGTGGP